MPFSLATNSILECLFKDTPVTAVAERNTSGWIDSVKCVSPPENRIFGSKDSKGVGSQHVVEVLVRSSSGFNERQLLKFLYTFEEQVVFKSPKSGPVDGGTPITLYVKAQKGNSEHFCRFSAFGNTITLRAHKYGKNNLVCLTPPLSTFTNQTESSVVQLEVKANDLGWLSADKFSYYGSPTVIGLHPRFLPEGRISTFAVRGNGFENSTQTMCCFIHKECGLYGHLVNSSFILCRGEMTPRSLKGLITGEIRSKGVRKLLNESLEVELIKEKPILLNKSRRLCSGYRHEIRVFYNNMRMHGLDYKCRFRSDNQTSLTVLADYVQGGYVCLLDLSMNSRIFDIDEPKTILVDFGYSEFDYFNRIGSFEIIPDCSRQIFLHKVQPTVVANDFLGTLDFYGANFDPLSNYTCTIELLDDVSVYQAQRIDNGLVKCHITAMPVVHELSVQNTLQVRLAQRVPFSDTLLTSESQDIAVLLAPKLLQALPGTVFIPGGFNIILHGNNFHRNLVEKCFFADATESRVEFINSSMVLCKIPTTQEPTTMKVGIKGKGMRIALTQSIEYVHAWNVSDVYAQEDPTGYCCMVVLQGKELGNYAEFLKVSITGLGSIRFLRKDQDRIFYSSAKHILPGKHDSKHHRAGFSKSFYNSGTYDVAVANGMDHPSSLSLVVYDRIKIQSVTPRHGPSSGLSQVILEGSGFMNVESLHCKFDSQVVTATWLTENRILCLSPDYSSPAGAVSLSVSNGGKDYFSAGVFTYFGRVIIETMLPTSGPYAGGTVVTLKGKGFIPLNSMKCRFAYVSVAASYVNANTIKCVSPRFLLLSDEELIPVTASINGIDRAFSNVSFLYTQPQHPFRIEPLAGSLNTNITIFGGDTEEFECQFVFNEAVYAKHHGSKRSCLVPEIPVLGYGATVDLRLVKDGTTLKSFPFQYFRQAQVSTVDVAYDLTTNKSVLQVSGSSFHPSLHSFCYFVPDTQRAQAIVISATKIHCDIPDSLSYGPLRLRISGIEQETNIEYGPPPSLLSINPKSGPSFGNTRVMIRARNVRRLSYNSGCWFGGYYVHMFGYNNTGLICFSPPLDHMNREGNIQVELQLQINGYLFDHESHPMLTYEYTPTPQSR